MSDRKLLAPIPDTDRASIAAQIAGIDETIAALKTSRESRVALGGKIDAWRNEVVAFESGGNLEDANSLQAVLVKQGQIGIAEKRLASLDSSEPQLLAKLRRLAAGTTGILTSLLPAQHEALVAKLTKDLLPAYAGDEARATQNARSTPAVQSLIHAFKYEHGGILEGETAAQSARLALTTVLAGKY